MNEIDLFPDNIRKQQLLLKWFKLAGISVLLLSIVLVGSFLTLREANAKIDKKINHFQAQREITNSNRLQLEELNAKRKNLKQQLDLLSGLRSGASAVQMFQMIDASLPGSQVWLTNWKFRRAGTPVEQNQQAVETGYFIVLPAGSTTTALPETWKIETNMNIQGQALDHVGISQFVLNLTQQPEIENVRIVNSRQIEVNQIKIVDFTLEILVSALKRSG